MAAVRAVARKPIAGASKNIGQRQIAKPTSGFTAPPQAEALRYLAAGGNPQNTLFADAINTFVYQAKSLGIWNAISCGWFFCADVQQAALTNLKDPSRFLATLTNAPTWTPGRGFTNLTNVNRVMFGGFGAGSSPAATGSTLTVLGATLNVSNVGVAIGTTPGNYLVWSVQSVSPAGFHIANSSTAYNGGRTLIGAIGLTAYLAGSDGFNSNGSLGGVESNYGTGATNPHPMTQLTAKIYADGSQLSGKQAGQLVGLVSTLIDAIGAQ